MMSEVESLLRVCEAVGKLGLCFLLAYEQQVLQPHDVIRRLGCSCLTYGPPCLTYGPPCLTYGPPCLTYGPPCEAVGKLGLCFLLAYEQQVLQLHA